MADITSQCFVSTLGFAWRRMSQLLHKDTNRIKKTLATLLLLLRINSEELDSVHNRKYSFFLCFIIFRGQ